MELQIPACSFLSSSHFKAPSQLYKGLVLAAIRL